MRLTVRALPLLLFLLPLAVPSPATAEGEKPIFKMGLILQDEKSKKSSKEKQIDAQVLNAATDAFLAAKRFKMVERNQLAAVFTEKSLQDFIGGKVNNKLTDVLALDLIGLVAYRVETKRLESGKLSTKWILEVRVIDVKTAAIIVTLTSDRASLMGMLPPATPDEATPLLTQSVRDAFPPMGYIVQINDKEVIVDLGSEEGLKKGDQLEVIQEGEQIIHPVTGQIMDAPLKVIAKLKVKSTSPQLSICSRPKKRDLKLADLVRLKGSESVIVKWLLKAPRILEEYKRKKEEMKVKK